jgi:hypothetical protein
MRRSVSKTRKALEKVSITEPLLALTDPRAVQHYQGIVASLPSTVRDTTGARMLASDAAKCAQLLDDIDARIAADGLVTVEGKAHPLLSARTATSSRLASILSRLKLVPQDDARELQRAGNFEQTMRAVTARVAGDDLLA